MALTKKDLNQVAGLLGASFKLIETMVELFERVNPEEYAMLNQSGLCEIAVKVARTKGPRVIEKVQEAADEMEDEVV